MSREDKAVYPKKSVSLQGLSLLIVSLILFGLSTVVVRPAAARTNWEVDTELVLTPGEPSPLGTKSATNWSVDHLSGNLTDYPDKLTTAMYWPNTNNTLVDTGLAVSANLETPYLTEEELYLTLDGYFARDFGADYPVGTYGGSSQVSFHEEGLNYWVTKGIINYGGFSYRATFVLEESQKSKGSYGSGLELALSGMKISGVSVELKTRLGMVPAPQEMVGDQPGSGFETFGLNGFTNSTVTLEGITFGPVKLDSSTFFNFQDGFDRTVFDFIMEEENYPLELEGKVQFSPEEKSVSLTPELDLEWADLNVSTSLTPKEITDPNNLISGLEIEGIGIEEIDLGTGEGSIKLCVGDYKLWKRKSTEDYQLRASDYIFSSLAEGEFSYEGPSAAYEPTDYNGVASLEGGLGNLYIAVDSYWNSDPGLFGISKVTGEAEYGFSSSFVLTTGVSISPGDGLEELVISPEISW